MCVFFSRLVRLNKFLDTKPKSTTQYRQNVFPLCSINRSFFVAVAQCECVYALNAATSATSMSNAHVKLQHCHCNWICIADVHDLNRQCRLSHRQIITIHFRILLTGT